MDSVYKVECLNCGDFAQRFRVVWIRTNNKCRFFGPWSEDYSYPKSASFYLADIGVLSGDEVWIQINPVFGSAQEVQHHVICDLECKNVVRYGLLGNIRNYSIDVQNYEELIDTTKWSARSALTEKDKKIFEVVIKEITDVKHFPDYVSYMVDGQNTHYLFYCRSENEDREPKNFYTAIFVVQSLLGDKDAYIESMKQIPVL